MNWYCKAENQIRATFHLALWNSRLICVSCGALSVLQQPVFLVCHLYHSTDTFDKGIEDWRAFYSFWIILLVCLIPDLTVLHIVKSFDKVLVNYFFFKGKNIKTKSLIGFRNLKWTDRKWHLLPETFVFFMQRRKQVAKWWGVSLKRLGKTNIIEENFLWFRCKVTE